MSEHLRMFYFVLYTVLYEGLIWGVFVYLMVFQGWSEMTVIVAIILSGAQFKPQHFGIKVTPKNPEDMDDEEFEKWKKVQKIKKETAEAEVKAANARPKTVVKD